jgi:hypothetical protein
MIFFCILPFSSRHDAAFLAAANYTTVLRLALRITFAQWPMRRFGRFGLALLAAVFAASPCPAAALAPRMALLLS